jgi:hypothetical protein
MPRASDPRSWREKALRLRTEAETTTDLLLARRLKASAAACECAAAGLEEALAARGQRPPVPDHGKAAAA